MKKRRFAYGGYNGELGPDQNINQPDIDLARKRAAALKDVVSAPRVGMDTTPIAAPAPAPIATADRIGMDTTPTPAPISSETIREMRRTTPTNAPKRVVSAAELANFGGSLRDFLNKERGLKRRSDTPDYEAALKSVARGKATPNPRDAELGKIRGMRKNPLEDQPLKKGGSIKAYASGGSVSSRADGCAQRGKTRGMMR
jgi:hypothetical protein